MSIAALAPFAGAAAGSLLGGTKRKTQALVPPDLAPLRQRQIDLLSWLTGTGDVGQARQRISDFFGGAQGLGSPVTALQRQATGGISDWLNQPAPETTAFNSALPALQGLLSRNPGQGILDALLPHFNQNLASANQQGARFSSGNEILRSRALDDYNLLAANALQQGVGSQLQAAQILGILGQSAGQGPFDRMKEAYGVGGAQAAQADLETQRRIQLLMQLLGTAQSATLGLPVQQNPSGLEQGAGLGLQLGALLKGTKLTDLIGV